MDNNQEAQVLNFDGEGYNVEDLTPRAATEFNYLFRLQNVTSVVNLYQN